MIIIKNNFIPVKGFIAMVTLFILWVRKEFNLTEVEENHERIHVYQQMELFIFSILIMTIICLFSNISWWWMMLTPLIPLLVYCICWIIEIILPPKGMAYKNICFETEAIYNEKNLNYCKSRKLFAWLKYISNKKYPYIPSWKRSKRQ